MENRGNIRKMESTFSDVVQYVLPMGEYRVEMNRLLDKPLVIEYLGKINCIRCGRETRKSFAQGYCYPCFISAPETEECVLHPELCRAHEGLARDLEYAQQHCLIEHVVYLSKTSGLKVGVTRHTQIPTRWIDQGATGAIELARTPNRYLAGLIEVAMKAHIHDKTNWRKMLSEVTVKALDLREEKARLSEMVPDSLKQYITRNEVVTELTYPVHIYPGKIRSMDLEKEPVIEGILNGIKGQYLIFSDDRVINIRKFGGYFVRIEYPG